MYYHVLIETKEKDKKGNNKECVEFNSTNLVNIQNTVIIPFLNGEKFQFSGYFLNPSEINRILIKASETTPQEIASERSSRLAKQGMFASITPLMVIKSDSVDDITTAIFDKVKASISTSENESIEMSHSFDNKKVFIVHGRDNLAKIETARFLEQLGLEAVILHEQVNSGHTIIEKLEEHTDVGFGIILYTPCDIGSLAGESSQKPRARQNVVFEHGYLIGKLGRNKVCALVKEDVETPADISGVVYIPLDTHGAWQLKIAKELRNAGYDVDMNKL